MPVFEDFLSRLSPCKEPHIAEGNCPSFNSSRVSRNLSENYHTDLCFLPAASTKMVMYITWSSGGTCPTTSARGRWMILTSPITTAIKPLTGTTGQLTASSQFGGAYGQYVTLSSDVCGLSRPTASITDQGANTRGGPTPPGGEERQETRGGPSEEGGPSWCSHHRRKHGSVGPLCDVWRFKGPVRKILKDSYQHKK